MNTVFKIIFTISVTFLLFSCNSVLKPEGELDDKIINFKTFDEVELNGSFRVIFVEDSVSKIRIETFHNLVENLKIEQNGFRISISENQNVSEEVEIYNVFIHSKKINEIIAENSILIDAPSFIRNEKLMLDLKDRVKFIAEIEVKDLIISISDEVDVNLKGSALNLELDATGNTITKMPFLSTENTDINLKDVAKAEINVKSNLEGEVKDNSQLIYIGSPSKDVQQKDLAKIEQKN